MGRHRGAMTAPERTHNRALRTPHAQPHSVARGGAQDSPWTCRVDPNPPGAVLVVRPADTARDVEVLLDGAPANDQPTVYLAPIAPEALTPADELRYGFVLTNGRPQFRDVRIRWTAVDGQRRDFVTTV